MNAPTPHKKASRGCLVALGALSALVMVSALVGGVLVYRFANTKEGKSLVGLVKNTTSMMAEAARAPGTNELRELGCDTAAVIDVERMGELLASFTDGGVAKASKRV